MLGRVTDVLPPALRTAAMAVRVFAADVQGVLPSVETGAPDLTAALERYAAAALRAERALVGTAALTADGLVRSADEYVDLDRLLVPRSLR